MGQPLVPRVLTSLLEQRGFEEERIEEAGGAPGLTSLLLTGTPAPPRAEGIEARTPGEARERQRRRTALSRRGRGGTLLTSPLGLSGRGGSTSQRTLLGR